MPSSSNVANKTSAPAIKRFRFLSSQLKAQKPASTHNVDTAAAQIARYMTEAAEADDVSGIDFWIKQKYYL